MNKSWHAVICISQLQELRLHYPGGQQGKEKKRKEKSLFSNHNGSLLRRQPGAAGVYLVDELHVAGESLQGLLADAGLPQEHGEVIRARHQPLWCASTCRLIPLKGCLHAYTHLVS